MSKWFRWYEGTTEDGKFRLIARNAGVTVATVIGVWAALLEDASHADHRGVSVKGEDYYAAILDMEAAEIVTILEGMQQANLITVYPTTIAINKWKDRQFETDSNDPTNADRQRRYREKQKQTPPKQISNGTVTETKRPDTDTDTDTESEVTPLPPKGAKRSRGSRLPDDWELPEDWRQWALVNCPASSLEAVNCEALKFANYWQAQPGSRACKLDWRKTFQNWCLTAFSRAPLRPHASQPAANRQGTNWYDDRRRNSEILMALAKGEAQPQ